MSRPDWMKVVCSIKPEFTQLIGAAMTYLMRRDADPGADFRLAVADGPGARAISALAQAADIPSTVSSEPDGGNGVDPFSWDTFGQLDAGARLKGCLDRALRVYELLRELAVSHPDEAMAVSALHERALRLLGLDSLVGVSKVLHRKTPPAPGPPQDDRTVVAAATSGLANRMLLIAGAMRIGELTGRRLVVHWPVNAQVGCSFDHLFANPLTLLRGGELDSLLAADRTLKTYNAWRTAAPLYSDVAEDGDPEADTILIKGWIYPKFPSEQYDHDFFRLNRRYLLRLRPQPRLAERVEAFPLPRGCVGVHIRRGGRQAEFLQSADGHFEAIMRRTVAVRPDVSFFLATDDACTEQKFRNLFPERISSLPKPSGDRTAPDGMEEALVDMLLLSRTQSILGNYFSSFSHAAAYWGDIPLVTAEAKTAGDQLATSVRTLLR